MFLGREASRPDLGSLARIEALHNALPRGGIAAGDEDLLAPPDRRRMADARELGFPSDILRRPSCGNGGRGTYTRAVGPAKARPFLGGDWGEEGEDKSDGKSWNARQHGRSPRSNR